jgi:hypothetical protein
VAAASALSDTYSGVSPPIAIRRQRELYGIESNLSPRLRTTSLMLNTGKVRAPVLVNVSDHELVLTLGVVNSLDGAGRAVDMYVYPGEYHIKYQPAHRLAMYNRNIDWMNFWLQGPEDPAPEKAAQYKHWHELRVQHCKTVPTHRSCTAIAKQKRGPSQVPVFLSLSPVSLYGGATRQWSGVPVRAPPSLSGSNSSALS